MIQQPELAKAAATTGAITIGGVVTGLDYATLLAGLAGGLASLSFLPPMSIWQRVFTPITATLTAGYAAPAASYYIQSWDGSNKDLAALDMFAAFAIGVVAQAVIPVVIKAARDRAAKRLNSEESSQ